MVLDVILEGRGLTGQEEPLVDIIAVHGLNPSNKSKKQHGYDTWTKDKHLWLKSLDKQFPRARVMLEYFDASPMSSNRYETFLQQSYGILEDIRIERDEDSMKEPDRPIIFLMHSLGGLIIKQALVQAKMNEKYSNIYTSTRCLMFFATPHGGGNESLVKWGSAASKAFKILTLKKKSDLFSVLKDDTVVVEHLADNFRQLYERVQIVSFYERLSTHGILVVESKHAAFHLGGQRENIVGLDAAHSDVCRFNPAVEDDQVVLKLVMANLQDLYKKALQGREAHMQFPDVTDDKRHPFGIALVDHRPECGEEFELRWGMIIEEIQWLKGDRCEGRVRSKKRKFQKHHVAIVLDQSLIQTLYHKSSQGLFDRTTQFAEETKEKFTCDDTDTRLVDRLFMVSTDKSYSNAIWQCPEDRYGIYVDQFGQLHNDALHVACLNQDLQMIEFLLSHVPAFLTKPARFVGRCIVENTMGWDVLYGTPLTAAFNAYVAIKRNPSLMCNEEHVLRAKFWPQVFEMLFSSCQGDTKSLWSHSINQQPLLGPESTMKADAQSLLSRAIYYNDHETFKRIINGAQKCLLEMDCLPGLVFFNFKECAGFYITEHTRLDAVETPSILRTLEDHSNEIKREGTGRWTGELKRIIPRIIWENLPCLEISRDLMKELLNLVLSQSNLDPQQTNWTAGSNLRRLLSCKQKPNLRAWSESRQYTSVMHYAAGKGDLGVFAALVDFGYNAWINYPDNEGRTPLTIAREGNYLDLVQYIIDNDGKEWQSVAPTPSGERSSISIPDTISSPITAPSPSASIFAWAKRRWAETPSFIPSTPSRSPGRMSSATSVADNGLGQSPPPVKETPVGVGASDGGIDSDALQDKLQQQEHKQSWPELGDVRSAESSLHPAGSISMRRNKAVRETFKTSNRIRAQDFRPDVQTSLTSQQTKPASVKRGYDTGSYESQQTRPEPSQAKSYSRNRSSLRLSRELSHHSVPSAPPTMAASTPASHASKTEHTTRQVGSSKPEPAPRVERVAEQQERSKAQDERPGSPAGFRSPKRKDSKNSSLASSGTLTRTNTWFTRNYYSPLSGQTTSEQRQTMCL